MIGDQGTEQLAIKDPDSQHPVATSWRPTFCEIAKRLAGGDYTLQGIPSVEAVSTAEANRIASYVSEYGETLVPLPEGTWKTSMAQWMEDYWEVLVDLWTAESGKSDLVISARVFEVDRGFRFEIQGVYVP